MPVWELDGQEVEVTNLDKVLFPDEGLTKGDLVGFYRDVAAVMLPHLEGRPLTLHRFPDGIGRDGFYQKDAADYFPDWLRTAEIERRGPKGGEIDQVYICGSTAALVYLANLGTITFHIWPARADDVDHPDLVVFDLDPPGDEQLDAVRDGARAIRDVLEEVGLVPFLQTSGSKGYHVVAPLDRSADFDAVRAFARGVADLVAGRDPDRLTTEQRKDKRRGRVFVDVGRNAYAQTAVCAYSVRARRGAPVATPIDWHELGRVAPRRYTIANLARRLGQKDDPWARLHDERCALAPAADALAPLRGG